MADLPDHYGVLNVAYDAEPEVIKAAYIALMKKHHPDHNSGASYAQLKAQRFNAAYAVLGDVGKRKAYDARCGFPHPSHQPRTSRTNSTRTSSGQASAQKGDKSDSTRTQPLLGAKAARLIPFAVGAAIAAILIDTRTTPVTTLATPLVSAGLDNPRAPNKILVRPLEANSVALPAVHPGPAAEAQLALSKSRSDLGDSPELDEMLGVKRGNALNAAGSAKSARPHVIEGASFDRLPSSDELAQLYPARALRLEEQGFATVQCSVGASGGPTECHVVDEEPAGLGFGDAALKAIQLFRLKPLDRVGQTVAGGVFTQRISFGIAGQKAEAGSALEEPPHQP
jgi:TonB family protein